MFCDLCISCFVISVTVCWPHNQQEELRSLNLDKTYIIQGILTKDTLVYMFCFRNKIITI